MIHSLSRQKFSLKGRALTVLLWAEWILLVCFSGWLLLQSVPNAWRSLNTDFPNYYIAAQLAREGFDTSHAYEWRWLARQKDHHQIDRAIIGLVPITPFSTLAVLPLTAWQPLTAKRVWILFQLALLLPIALALREITGQPLRRIALLMVACLPLHRNLLYGQYYILLLALLTGACWALQRKRPVLAGTLVAVAAAAKIFPVIFILYFIRKRQWRAVGAALIAGAVCAGVSVAAFGWEMHRVYLLQVLPWTLHGDTLPPYHLGSGSLSTLLHCLFLYEPQWNPHPWHLAPATYAVLQAVLPALLFWPALLLVDERDHTAGRIALEWSALLAAALTVSTIPASYNFTVLILPIVVLVAWLLPRRPYLASLTVALYAGIAWPDGWKTASGEGLGVLLQVPRLYILVALLLLFYSALGTFAWRGVRQRSCTFAVAAAAVVATICSAVAGVHRQRGLYEDYTYRVADSSGAFLSATPQSMHGDILRIAMRPNGYRLLQGDSTTTWNTTWPEASVGLDQISFATNARNVFVEEASQHSRIASLSGEYPAIEDAESPTASPNGESIAYTRTTLGRGRLFVRSLNAKGAEEQALTPESLNVEQAAFLPDASLIVSAAIRGIDGERLWRILPGHLPEMLPLGEARFPAASPDGRWLAYSRWEQGAWHLAVLNLHTGISDVVTHAACNAMEPAWEPDSRTVLYGSDCGRALWFAAICRRRIVF